MQQAIFTDLVGTDIVASHCKELTDLTPELDTASCTQGLAVLASETRGTDVTGCYSTYCRWEFGRSTKPVLEQLTAEEPRFMHASLKDLAGATVHGFKFLEPTALNRTSAAQEAAAEASGAAKTGPNMCGWINQSALQGGSPVSSPSKSVNPTKTNFADLVGSAELPTHSLALAELIDLTTLPNSQVLVSETTEPAMSYAAPTNCVRMDELTDLAPYASEAGPTNASVCYGC